MVIITMPPIIKRNYTIGYYQMGLNLDTTLNIERNVISYLEEFIVGHMSGQSCERLASRPAHSHQQGVATGLLDDARNTRHVLYGKSETGHRYICENQMVLQKVIG